LQQLYSGRLCSPDYLAFSISRMRFIRENSMTTSPTFPPPFSRKKTTIRESYVCLPSMRLLAVSGDPAVDDDLRPDGA
jgi:hypothetical protein